MNIAESFAFYLVVGIAVAVAYWVVERASWLSSIAACLFWPLYLPLVLSSRAAVPEEIKSKPAADDLTAAIEQVEHELDAALAGLDGWAESVLQQKSERLRELRGALVAQADRIRDMEALLVRENSAPARLETSADPSERWQRSCQARQENMARLDRLCRQARTDLLATLAWVRELVSMIHLAKFTGAPAARAEELVAQIAAAVESISSLAQPDPVTAGEMKFDFPVTTGVHT